MLAEIMSTRKDPYGQKYRPQVSATLYTQANPPDTSIMNSSDICHEIKLLSGEKFEKCRPSELLRHRLMSSRKHLGPQRTRLSRGALPNSSRVLCELAQGVLASRFSPDGTKFVTASGYNTGEMKVFDVEGRNLVPVKNLCRLTNRTLLDVAFSPDCRHAALGILNRDHINLLSFSKEIETPLYLRPAFGDNFGGTCLDFSDDGMKICAGNEKGAIYVYDLQRGDRTLAFRGHVMPVNCTVNAVHFADDSSNLILSGSHDNIVKMWDRRTLSGEMPKPAEQFVGHKKWLIAISPRGDGRYILSSSQDNTIKLWDLRKPSSCADDGSHDDPSVMNYRGHDIYCSRVPCHFSPLHTTGQRYVYTGGFLITSRLTPSAGFVIYDVLTGLVVKQLEGHQSVVRDVSWHPYQDNFVATSSWNGMVRLWDHNMPGSGRVRRELRGRLRIHD